MHQISYAIVDINAIDLQCVIGIRVATFRREIKTLLIGSYALCSRLSNTKFVKQTKYVVQNEECRFFLRKQLTYGFTIA